MKSHLNIRLVVLTCLFGFFAAPAVAEVAAKPPTLSAEQLKALLPKLEKGGYVLYFRHAASDMFQLDDQPTMGDCSTQRTLSDEGRDQARSIGNAFRKHHIPVGMVKTSPFCRCVDTATLAFKRSEVDESLFFATRLSAAERKANAKHLKTLMAMRPKGGTNSIIVAHNANLMEAYGIWPDEEGDAFLYKPNGVSAGAPLARIPVGLWQQLSH